MPNCSGFSVLGYDGALILCSYRPPESVQSLHKNFDHNARSAAYVDLTPLSWPVLMGARVALARSFFAVKASPESVQRHTSTSLLATTAPDVSMQ
jgi:hypothetical protein